MLVRSMRGVAAPNRWSTLPLVLLASVTPGALIAQASVEIGPLVALYSPLGRHDVFSVGLPAAAGDLRGVAWGAEGRFWLTPRFGVQIQGAVRSSRFGGGLYPPCTCCVPCLPSQPSTATVVVSTAQAVYRPSPAGFPFWLSAGGGVVRRGGPAYADAGSGEPASFAGALGAGCNLRLGRRVSASFGVTTLFYQVDVASNAQLLEHGFQADVLAHLGLTWRWGMH